MTWEDKELMTPSRPSEGEVATAAAAAGGGGGGSVALVTDRVDFEDASISPRDRAISRSDATALLSSPRLRHNLSLSLDESEAEEELRKAARVGLALLERNEELENEHKALQTQVATLQCERNELKLQLAACQDELELMTDARRVAVLEVHSVQKRLEDQQELTQLAQQRIERLEVSLEESRQAQANAVLMQHQMQSELHQLRQKQTLWSENKELAGELEQLRSEMNALESRQQSVCDQKAALEQDKEQLMQEKSVWTQSMETLDQVQAENVKLASECEQLTSKLHHIEEELVEQKKLVESSEMMNAMYKEIVDSRSEECTCAASTSTGSDTRDFKSFQEELAEANEKLVEQVVEFQKRDAMRTSRGGDWEVIDGEGDDENEWIEETREYPAPPGDLDSPLIKCLLDHWTHEKTKRLSLTDWLHNAIRKSTPSSCLRLENLSSEVTAGFCQLLLPVLREKHGLNIALYRRVHREVISDLILTTDRQLMQPVTAIQKHQKELERLRRARGNSRGCE